MLGRVYLEKNMITIVYESMYAGNEPGVKYELGQGVISLLDLDIYFVKKNLYNFGKQWVYLLENISEEKMLNSKYLKMQFFNFNSLSPQLHFYIQAFFLFLKDFNTMNFPGYHQLFCNTTNDCYHLYSDLLEAMVMIDKDNSVKKLLNEYNDYYSYQIPFISGTALNYIEKMELLLKSAVDAIILTIREKQGILIDDMNFVINSKQDDLNTLSPIQRLYLADYQRISQNKKSLYIDKTLNIRYAPKIITYNKNHQYETIKQHLINQQTDIVPMYEINYFDDFLRFEFIQMLENKMRIKKCPYCSRFFLNTGSENRKYCNTVAAGETFPCDQIGPRKIYERQNKQQPILKFAERVYNKMNKRANKCLITQNQFNEWSDKYSEYRKGYKNNTISYDEFYRWLMDDPFSW